MDQVGRSKLEWRIGNETISHSLRNNRVVRDIKFSQHSSLNTGAKKRMVMVRSITVSQILKRWCNSHNIDDIRGGNVPSKEEQLLVGRELKV